MELENRVVVLIDMDCFYCQVEEKLDPNLKGKPIAVVQYNPWKGGGIIAVNYVARAMGVTRHMRGDEAKEKCPEIQLPSVPCVRGKADISKYRDAGKEVANVLKKFTPLLERASIDEAYLDITAPVEERLKNLNMNTVTIAMMPNTYALGYESIDEFIDDVYGYGNDCIDFDYDHAKRLLIGAVVVSEIRAAVYQETGYRCSAGIAHNKILAKLVCGMNKPNKQTVLPKHSINILYKTLPLKKVKHLGGKFGYSVCETLKINTMGELQRFSERELQTRFDEKNGTWLYNIARGIDLEPVEARFNSKSIGCCKQLRGKSAVTDLDSLRKWLQDLSEEIEERLEKDAFENNRTPKQMVLSYSANMPDGRDANSSKSYNFTAYDDLTAEFIAAKALELCLEGLEGTKTVGETNRKLRAPVKFLGISVGKFEDHAETKTRKIYDYFAAGSSNANNTNDNAKPIEEKASTKKANKKNEEKEYILQKFFQTTTERNVESNVVKESSPQKEDETVEPQSILESPLHVQESFFTKFLNNSAKTGSDPKNNEQKPTSHRPATPKCDVITRGDDSTDTEYSNSTINNEINKSIALFDADPQDATRVSNIRELLNKTAGSNDSCDDLQPQEPVNGKTNKNNAKNKTKSPQNAETFACTQCKKNIPVSLVETHGDYHFALTLREEERQRIRDEFQRKTKQKSPAKKEGIKKNNNEEPKKKNVKEDQNKNETVTSIKTYFPKVDNKGPTESCAECGKRVAVEKFTEHLDFHEAQKLNRELNRNTMSTRSFTANSVKRKRSDMSPDRQKFPRNSRSIDSFFRS